jgi:hypothetical protein
MSIKIWSSDRNGQGDPPYLPDERFDLAQRAWIAAAEHIQPELSTSTNARVVDTSEKHQAFEFWWKSQIDPCRFIIAANVPESITDPSIHGGYFHCVLAKGHNVEHQAHKGITRCHINGTWFMPESEQALSMALMSVDGWVTTG